MLWTDEKNHMMDSVCSCQSVEDCASDPQSCVMISNCRNRTARAAPQEVEEEGQALQTAVRAPLCRGGAGEILVAGSAFLPGVHVTRVTVWSPGKARAYRAPAWPQRSSCPCSSSWHVTSMSAAPGLLQAQLLRRLAEGTSLTSDWARLPPHGAPSPSALCTLAWGDAVLMCPQGLPTNANLGEKSQKAI